MRFFLIGFVLSFFLVSFAAAQTDSLSPMQPEDGAETITLDQNSNLILQSPVVSGAQEYRYQYWKEGDPVPEFGVDELIPSSGGAVLLIPPSDLQPGATYLWHVRTCTSVNSCGPVNDPLWSFTYLLPPPTQLTSPINQVAPVTFEWTPVQGATWYNILLKPCPAGIKEEFKEGEEGEDCNELVLSSDETIEKDDSCLIDPEEIYTWSASACLNQADSSCGPYSQIKELSVTANTTLPVSILKSPKYIPNNPITPENEESIPVISKTDSLVWDILEGCAYGYRLVLSRTGQTIVSLVNQFGSGDQLGDITSLWEEPEDLDTVWEWQVFSCSNVSGGVTCEKIGSEVWKFKTAGATPVLKSPLKGTATKVPIILSWEDTGAPSYVYELSSLFGIKTAIVNKTTIELPYQQELIEPGQRYSWKVKTCIDRTGEICGKWSLTETFFTHPLRAPLRPKLPLHEGELFLPGQLSWQEDPGTTFYQYQVQYTNTQYGTDENGDAINEELEGCSARTGSIIIPLGGGNLPVISRTSFSLNEKCLGQYTWQVNSCYDSSCTKTENGSAWSFTAISQPSSGTGLVPCERISPNDATPYDERESCQFKHIGFLFQNILDFVLWKLSLLILAALAVFVGASTYFSFGSPDTLVRIRTIFRSYLYGVLLLLFAWMIINIVMALFGFNIEFFGRWWELPF